MKERLQLVAWKVCIVVMGVVLLSKFGLLLAGLNKPETEEALHFQALDIMQQEEWDMAEKATENVDAPISTPAPTPFVLTNFDRIRVVITNKETGSIYHEKNNSVNPADYRGEMEVVETSGGFVFINDLPLEEYLYSVVPSEMPASYPIEALKAQAICARTYAYLHILSPGYPQWNAHVDDTTAYQVYHNVEEQERTTQAVRETQGMVLLAPDGMGLAQTYYYSTSCGFGSDAHVWRTKYADSYPYLQAKALNKQTALSQLPGAEGDYTQTMAMGNSMQGSVLYTADSLQKEDVFAGFITNVNYEDWEAQEPWYRWKYHVKEADTERMLHTLQKRYEANEELILTLEGREYVSKPIKELDVLVDLVIDKRGAGGVADELIIITEKNVYKVITELNIRYVLNDGGTKVTRHDGTEVVMNSLLPSGYFVINNDYEDGAVGGYQIIGGGFGHGAGMSQNAAKAMALEGMTATDILSFFYEECAVEKAG